jgi:hypothetical protein
MVHLAFANEGHERLMKLSPKERNVMLTKFMQTSGEPDCTVTESFFQGGKNGGGTGDVFWNVRCANKKTFSIMVKDDAQGSTSILECNAMKALTHFDCFRKFPKE